MEYLDVISAICNEANLTKEQTTLIKDITNPMFEKDRTCNVKDIREIISSLVTSEQCEKLGALIQKKWEHYEKEPNAYPDLCDDVSCG